MNIFGGIIAVVCWYFDVRGIDGDVVDGIDVPREDCEIEGEVMRSYL